MRSHDQIHQVAHFGRTVSLNISPHQLQTGARREVQATEAQDGLGGGVAINGTLTTELHFG